MFALPASMASVMYPATFAAMEVTHLEPALREPGATPRLSCWPWKSTRPPAVQLEPSDAVTGIAERDARETRVSLHPHGREAAIVTLIAAILSNTNDETRVCQVRARGKRRGVIRRGCDVAQKSEFFFDKTTLFAAHLRQSRKTE